MKKTKKAGEGMPDASRIYSSAEDYLETILILRNLKGTVRSIDIANEMGFSKPSVSVAMKNLREKGCITVSPEGWITLLPKGQEIADRIYERHVLITKWLTAIGVPEDVAAEDACRMEHVISVQSFEALKDFAAEMEARRQGQ